MKGIPCYLVAAALILTACSVQAVVPTVIPLPSATSAMPSSIPTPKQTETPSIPTIDVDGVQVPDPTVTNPELFDITKLDSPIPKFIGAMAKAGIEVTDQQILDAFKDPTNFQSKTGVDGKSYVQFVYKINQDGVDYSTGLLYDQENGWREATIGNLAKINGLLVGNNIRLNTGSSIPYPDSLINAVVTKEFNLAALDENFKFWHLEPSQGVFYFTMADAALAVAQNAGLTPMGDGLIYGYNNFNHPWLKGQTFTQQQIKDIVTNHITQVISHFKGKISYWGVVNEVGNEDGFLKFDPTYPQEAFTVAGKADPNAQLIYNFEINNLNSVDGQKLALFKKVDAKNMVMGIEAHLYESQITDEATIIKTLQGYGVPIAITELDINVKDFQGTPEQKQQKQAELYQKVIHAAIKSDVCRLINFWETGDKYSWLEDPSNTGPRYSPLDAPTLYNDDLSPKPALFAVRGAITDAAP